MSDYFPFAEFTTSAWKSSANYSLVRLLESSIKGVRGKSSSAVRSAFATEVKTLITKRTDLHSIRETLGPNVYCWWRSSEKIVIAAFSLGSFLV